MRTVSQHVSARKPAGNVPGGRFTAADAPPAACNRALRRLWVAEANRIFRRTGNPDEACQAGAEWLVAALDCDALTARVVRKTKGSAPVNLPVAAKRREGNRDGALDRMAEAIRRGVRP
jgi:hypothetical protein